MNLNSTPSAQRLHIGFFGLRNAGKSSLVNRITNQNMSLVSDIKGTTTDAVKKSMELLPLGPVVIIDTPGFDDEGKLGQLRVKAAERVMKSCDIAVLVTDNEELNTNEKALLTLIKAQNIPYLIVHNKSDIKKFNKEKKLCVSAVSGDGIEKLKYKISEISARLEKKIHFISDFINENDTVILVCPIDESAPKGRMIMPQQLAIRETLDKNAAALVVQPKQLRKTLDNLKTSPSLVVTDSQAFKEVMNIVPRNIRLTSFSILMARYKGFLDTALNGVKTLDDLKDGDRILISEGCTHHRQCGDIGTVKLPDWIKKYANKNFEFEFTSGHGFPDDLTKYDLIIHCGGCMLGDAEMKSRRDEAIRQAVPFTNYGTVIAKINGILDRSTEIFK